MNQKTFRAMVVRENQEGGFTRQVEDRTTGDLPQGDVLVQVHYSSLNYKDALSATGNRGVTRSFPHTPGIDAAGVIEASETDEFRPGDRVIVTSYDLGMNTAGGWGQYIRVPADWVVPLPPGLTLHQSMIYGTAGFTAGLSILGLLQNGVAPDAGEVLVTGATGGVGSIAVGILALLGYRVVAATGKPEETQFLQRLGASAVIDREELLDTSGRPLLQGRWAGVVDTVGGEYLATALKSTLQFGVVTCCGLVASPELSTTVYPFILRGVRLLGVDSQECPMDIRRQVWQRLAGEWSLPQLEELASEGGLEDLEGEIDHILKGQRWGRFIVNLDD